MAATLLDTLSWLVLDHFREYGDWPWQHVNSFENQWREHPSFVCCELMFIALSMFSFVHAIRSSDDARHRRFILVWVASFVAGTLNDYIFMLLPIVDNFWQAQALFMLTPRMPVYIPCVYNAFMYWSCVAASRVFREGNRCPWAEACLSGLLAGIFYAPYDLCGARFLWWTWHESDAGVKLRWLGVPAGSTAWTITFTASFSFLLRRAADKSHGFLGSLGMCCFSTPLMMVILNAFNIPAMDPLGMPGPRTIALAVAVFASVVVHRLWKPNAKEKVASDSGITRLCILCYFAFFVFVMATFAPEDQVSTGAHQIYGPCEATDIDLLGHKRNMYMCNERYPRWYFHFECPSAIKGSAGRWSHVHPGEEIARKATDRVSWFTICGRAHESYHTWLAVVIALCGVGASLFMWAFAGESDRRKKEA